MAGASISLIDFFEDLLKSDSSNEEEPEKKSLDISKTRVLAAFLALAPPVLLAYSYPDIFRKLGYWEDTSNLYTLFQ